MNLNFRYTCFATIFALQSCAQNQKVEKFLLNEGTDYQIASMSINASGNLEISENHFTTTSLIGYNDNRINDKLKVIELAGGAFREKSEIDFNPDKSFMQLKSSVPFGSGYKLLIKGYNGASVPQRNIEQGDDQIVITCKDTDVVSIQHFAEKGESYQKNYTINCGEPIVGINLKSDKFIYSGFVSGLWNSCFTGFFRVINGSKSYRQKIKSDCVCTQINNIVEDDNSNIFLMGRRSASLNGEELQHSHFKIFVSAYNKDFDNIGQWEYDFNPNIDWEVMSACAIKGVGIGLLVESEDGIKLVVIDKKGDINFQKDLPNASSASEHGCIVQGHDGELAIIYNVWEDGKNQSKFIRVTSWGKIIDEVMIDGELDWKSYNSSKQDLIYDSKLKVYYVEGFKDKEIQSHYHCIWKIHE